MFKISPEEREGLLKKLELVEKVSDSHVHVLDNALVDPKRYWGGVRFPASELPRLASKAAGIREKLEPAENNQN